MNILIKLLLALLSILADFIIIYLIWGIIQSMRLTKYAKFNKLKQEEANSNKKLKEIEVKLDNLTSDYELELEKKNKLILDNYNLISEKNKLLNEILETAKEAVKNNKINIETTTISEDIKEKIIESLSKEKELESEEKNKLSKVKKIQKLAKN